MTLGEKGDFYYREALRWLWNTSGKIPALVGWKLFSFWFSPLQLTYNFRKNTKATIVLVTLSLRYFAILLLFILGLFKTFSLRRHRPFLVYLLGELVIVLVYYGNRRASSFLRPILLLFACSLFFEPERRARRALAAD